MSAYFYFVVLPNLSVIGGFLLVAFFVLTVFIGIMSGCEFSNLPPKDVGYYHEQYKDFLRIFKLFKKSLSAFVVFLIIAIFSPSEQQITKVMVINTVSEIKGIKELPENIVARLNKILAVAEEK